MPSPAPQALNLKVKLLSPTLLSPPFGSVT